MKDVLFVFLFLFLLGYGLSILMIKKYLWKRDLSPKWKILTGLSAPWNELGAYISSTKKNEGHVGIWFTLMVASFIAMMLTALILAIS